MYISIQKYQINLQKPAETWKKPSNDLLLATISGLRVSERNVLYYLMSFGGAAIICPTTKTIARELGIHRKTVERATKELIRLGLLTRKRRFKRSNIYTLREDLRRGKHNFSAWFNRLTQHQQIMYQAHGIVVDSNQVDLLQSANVPTYLSSLVVESYIKNRKRGSYRIVSACPTARENSTHLEDLTSAPVTSFNLNLKQQPTTTLKRKLGNDSLRSKSNIRNKGSELNTEASLELVKFISKPQNSFYRGITFILQLDASDAALLFAFPNSILKEAFSATRNKKLQRPGAWFFKICRRICKEKGIDENREYCARIAKDCGTEKFGTGTPLIKETAEDREQRRLDQQTQSDGKRKAEAREHSVNYLDDCFSKADEREKRCLQKLRNEIISNRARQDSTQKPLPWYHADQNDITFLKEELEKYGNNATKYKESPQNRFSSDLIKIAENAMSAIMNKINTLETKETNDSPAHDRDTSVTPVHEPIIPHDANADFIEFDDYIQS